MVSLDPTENFDHYVPSGSDSSVDFFVEDELRNPIIHSMNLFDQDEDEAGELYDLAIGKRIDNSTYDGMEDLTIQQDDFEPDEFEPDEFEQIQHELNLQKRLDEHHFVLLSLTKLTSDAQSSDS